MGSQDARCAHEESLYGRCTACGMTWEQQARAAAPAVPSTPHQAESDAINALQHRYDNGGYLSNVVWNVRNEYTAWPDGKIDARSVRWIVEGFLAELASERAGGAGRELADSRQEFAIFDDLDRKVGFQTFGSIESAQEHLAWLVGERRDEMQRAAEENEASDFKGGNEPYYRWHNPRDGEKDRTYRIARREVTFWAAYDDIPPAPEVSDAAAHH